MEVAAERFTRAATEIILDPKYQPILAILKGARNGFVYGVRVRAPHALVMAILFKSGTWQSKLNFIYKATKLHALNLARFVTLYKTSLLAIKVSNGGKERPSDTFFAGLLSGWYVFGERNAINEQNSPNPVGTKQMQSLPKTALRTSSSLKQRFRGRSGHETQGFAFLPDERQLLLEVLPDPPQARLKISPPAMQSFV
ncbi:peroxisomal membrane protein 4, partial [Phenoliferia sp. Uapishka_3]